MRVDQKKFFFSIAVDNENNGESGNIYIYFVIVQIEGLISKYRHSDKHTQKHAGNKSCIFFLVCSRSRQKREINHDLKFNPCGKSVIRIKFRKVSKTEENRSFSSLCVNEI